jgi:chemotaxis protein CheX
MIAAKDIQDVVCNVWTTTLGIALECREPGSAAVPEPTVAASVHIAGGCEGSLVILCSAACARGVAARMFEVEPAEVSVDDVRDAMGELANMVGGNIKGLLGAPCHLSLPTLVEGTAHRLAVKGVEPASWADFDCDGEALSVKVYAYGG